MTCWFDFKDGHTCMLPDGHDGPHEPTPDDEIIISVNASGHRYMVEAANRRSRCRICDPEVPRHATTHVGMVDGVALTSGCEWQVRRWVKHGEAS